MRKKLREAHYFLSHRQAVSQRVVGDPEEFEFLLSALLSASRSITDPLESRRYEIWFQAWRDGRTPREEELLEFMRVQRNAEVHREGADVDVAMQFLPIIQAPTGRHGHPARDFNWSAPPGTPPPVVGVNVHHFELDGTAVEAYGTCRDSTALLDELAVDFEAAHPGA